MSRTHLHQCIMDAIVPMQRQGRAILLVAHFGNVYEALARQLDEKQISFELLQRSVTPAEFMFDAEQRSGAVVLALSELLNVESRRTPERKTTPSVAVMMAERHPHPLADSTIEQWCRQLALPTELGWYVALDDEIVRRLLPQSLIDLMLQMGLGPNDLISSHMLARRLRTMVRRHRHIDTTERFAESCGAWMKKHCECQADKPRHRSGAG